MYMFYIHIFICINIYIYLNIYIHTYIYGVILNVLRSRWDRNSLCTRVWAKGHSQRMIMHSAGASFNPVESAQLIQLAAEVMRHCAQSSYHDLEERARFLQTGSTWLRELAIDNMSNWSRISLLTTETILNTMEPYQPIDH